ncbi:hypothetical protein F4778DRAFT_787 [Xylariomycetidae sp. FL2044]|nr:hypothetical protein F4778DRAFT_787 [Xylariomycetidae sp. FL2044]
MRSTRILPLLASLTAATLAPIADNVVVSYDGHAVYRLSTRGRPAPIQAKLSTIRYEAWSDATDKHLDIMVSPDQRAAFEALGLDYRVMHEDLGASIAAEFSAGSSSSSSAAAAGRKGKGKGNMWRRQAEGGNSSSSSSWFDSYHNYEDHIEYFDDLQASFPENSEIVSSGTSYQGRDIFGIHFWGAGGPGKPVVLYHGTTHAREWISSMVIEYVTTQLIEGYQAGDNLTTSFLDKYDFYVFPFVNPDGFVYTQTTDRLWRKNRMPPPASAPLNQTCFGRDVNRNWPFAWDANPRGASTDPCSSTYKGEAPADTPEVQGLSGLVAELRDGPGIKLFVDWHSYGQLILSPFGYQEDLYAPALGRWTKTADLVSEAIRDYGGSGNTYTFGPWGVVLYASTGCASDHVYAEGNADFSYTIELRDTGEYGFVLPPELVRPTAEEQWEGQRVMLDLLDEEFFDGIGDA